MLQLKRQEFRAKQRLSVLNNLFQQRRTQYLFQTKIDNIFQNLNSNFDSLLYQQSIQQVLDLSCKVNLSQLYSKLVGDLVEQVEYQMDVGYYILDFLIFLALIHQMEMAQQPQILALVKQYGIRKLIQFSDPIMLQFLELYLLQSEALDDQEVEQIYEELIKWAQSVNWEYVISAIHCLNLLLRFNKYILSPEVSVKMLQLLNTEYSQLGLEVIMYSNWDQFTEEQLMNIWGEVCKELLKMDNQQICLQILHQISRVYSPFLLNEIIEYLTISNDYFTNQVFVMLSEMEINRNYDPIIQKLLDVMCQRVQQDLRRLPSLKQLLKHHELYVECHNFPIYIDQLL